MRSAQRTARIAGALYLVTFATSIPALLLKGPVLDDPHFILGSSSEHGVLWAGFLEVILAIACVGTAVVLYPIARRQSETAALGFLAARVLEAAIIVVGVISLLSIVTLRQQMAGVAEVDEAALVTLGAGLVAIHDWTFLLGPGLIPAVNALCLGYVMYRSRLIPQVIPLVGLIGAPLLAVSATATLFGLYDQVSPYAAIAALPIAFWELSLGIWLVTMGFRADALAKLVEADRHEMAL